MGVGVLGGGEKESIESTFAFPQITMGLCGPMDEV